MKPAYQYDFSGMFTGITEADASPLEPGVFLVPGRSTLVRPPDDLPADKWPRWNGSAWELITRPLPANDDNDPVAKLRDFLAANPDVAALLNQGGV